MNKTHLQRKQQVIKSITKKAIAKVTKQTGKTVKEITLSDIQKCPKLTPVQKRYARKFYLEMHPEVKKDMEADEKFLKEKSNKRVERKYAKKLAKRIKARKSAHLKKVLSHSSLQNRFLLQKQAKRRSR